MTRLQEINKQLKDLKRKAAKLDKRCEVIYRPANLLEHAFHSANYEFCNPKSKKFANAIRVIKNSKLVNVGALLQLNETVNKIHKEESKIWSLINKLNVKKEKLTCTCVVHKK